MTIYVTYKVFQALYAAGLLVPMNGDSYGKVCDDGMIECQLIAGERALEFPA